MQKFIDSRFSNPLNKFTPFLILTFWSLFISLTLSKIYISTLNIIDNKLIACATINSVIAFTYLFHRFRSYAHLKQSETSFCNIPGHIQIKIVFYSKLSLLAILVTIFGILFWQNLGQRSASLLTPIFTIILWAPIVEELVFRGCLSPFLVHVSKSNWGIYYSVLSFAWIHSLPTMDDTLNGLTFLALGPLTLGFCSEFLYKYSGSLVLPILFHMVCNSLSIALFS